MSEVAVPSVGDTASVEHVFTQEDVAAFARLSGDDNPVHLDDDAARRMGFSGTIVHGLLAASLISLPVLAVESRADLPRLAEALRAPGPLAAVVRTSLSAVLPPATAAPE